MNVNFDISGTEYLSEDFNMDALRVPEIRNILVKHETTKKSHEKVHSHEKKKKQESGDVAKTQEESETPTKKIGKKERKRKHQDTKKDDEDSHQMRSPDSIKKVADTATEEAEAKYSEAETSKKSKKRKRDRKSKGGLERGANEMEVEQIHQDVVMEETAVKAAVPQEHVDVGEKPQTGEQQTELEAKAESQPEVVLEKVVDKSAFPSYPPIPRPQKSTAVPSFGEGYTRLFAGCDEDRRRVTSRTKENRRITIDSFPTLNSGISGGEGGASPEAKVQRPRGVSQAEETSIHQRRDEYSKAIQRKQRRLSQVFADEFGMEEWRTQEENKRIKASNEGIAVEPTYVPKTVENLAAKEETLSLKCILLRVLLLISAVGVVFATWKQNEQFVVGYRNANHSAAVKEIQLPEIEDGYEKIGELANAYLRYAIDKFIKPQGLRCPKHGTCLVGASIPRRQAFGEPEDTLLSKKSTRSVPLISELGDFVRVFTESKENYTGEPVLKCNKGYVVRYPIRYASNIYPFAPICVPDKHTAQKIADVARIIEGTLKRYRGSKDCDLNIEEQILEIKNTKLDKINSKTLTIKKATLIRESPKDVVEIVEGVMKKYVKARVFGFDGSQDSGELEDPELIATHGMSEAEIKQVLRSVLFMTSADLDKIFDAALDKISADEKSDIQVVNLESEDADGKESSELYLVSKTTTYSLFCQLRLLLLLLINVIVSNLKLLTPVVLISWFVSKRFSYYKVEKMAVKELVSQVKFILETASKMHESDPSTYPYKKVSVDQLKSKLMYDSNGSEDDFGPANVVPIEGSHSLYDLTDSLINNTTKYYFNNTACILRVWDKVVQEIETKNADTISVVADYCEGQVVSDPKYVSTKFWEWR
ncbi:hypothetical protein AX774_g2449 [Zancudomyces culisetae]|uniref:Man1/Src1-like C-terminal domain-containing protein n=1 Tax=Zancudomyces culisetae TaxID=1213189 RepID=A0A1R1PT04_ZANCU|nr:hypothetical protein AX774_g2449 [Zancudomyces culisetae]|eukprot:OMH84033.1 hypothetical protein AX774_g2449 [Zancudomyces culisetae]